MLRHVLDEEDRGLVLAMNAFVEDALRRLLLTYMRPGKTTIDLLDGFNAPLGTLAARIKACSALGLLHPIQLADLELARKVRNQFAHGWEPCSLSEPKIAALVERMSGDRFLGGAEETLKKRFHSTLLCALTEMESLRQRLQEANQRLPALAYRLVAADPAADHRPSTA